MYELIYISYCESVASISVSQNLRILESQKRTENKTINNLGE